MVKHYVLSASTSHFQELILFILDFSGFQPVSYLMLMSISFIHQGSNVASKRGRVHCSLNINTETGRLSARRPNLQVSSFIFCLFSYSPNLLGCISIH